MARISGDEFLENGAAAEAGAAGEAAADAAGEAADEREPVIDPDAALERIATHVKQAVLKQRGYSDPQADQQAALDMKTIAKQGIEASGILHDVKVPDVGQWSQPVRYGIGIGSALLFTGYLAWQTNQDIDRFEQQRAAGGQSEASETADRDEAEDAEPATAERRESRSQSREERKEGMEQAMEEAFSE